MPNPLNKGWGDSDVEYLAAWMGDSTAATATQPLTGWTQAKYAQDLLDCITRITGD